MPGARDRLRVLAFEPFDGGSHRVVRESITRRSRHAWRWFTRPARAWKWRMRLAALELAEDARNEGGFDAPIDAIFATSLLSLPDLVASLPATHRATPTILSMHENQAAYPAGPRVTPDDEERDVHFALTNLASVLTADLTIWNSAWNRRSFRDGIERVLAHAPDRRLDAGARLDERPGVVVWPPVELPPGDDGPEADTRDRVLHKPARVVWPHRWEHDKGPEELLSIADAWTEALDLRWTILGERYRRTPPALATFMDRFADRIDHAGFEPDRDAYWRHLRRCDWVLSTARHEFFGIAVTEALLAGCLPWLPDRLSYPELLPPAARGLTPADPPAEVAATRRAIQLHLAPAAAAQSVARLDAAIEGVVTASPRRRAPPGAATQVP